MALSFEKEYKAGVQAYEEVVDKGEMEMADMGFPPAERPVDTTGEFGIRPKLPAKLSVLSMAEMQDLMGWFTSWYSYSMEMLPRVTADKNAAASKKDFAWAKIRNEKRGTVSDKDNGTRVDSRYVAINTEYEKLEYKYRHLAAVCKSLEREIDTISRAQSALEQRNHGEGSRVSGERTGRRMETAMAGFRNGKGVMARFRR
jgi:hypothetical protein